MSYFQGATVPNSLGLIPGASGGIIYGSGAGSLITDFSFSSGLWRPVYLSRGGQTMAVVAGGLQFNFPGPQATSRLNCMGLVSRFKLYPDPVTNQIVFRSAWFDLLRGAITANSLCFFGQGLYKHDNSQTGAALCGAGFLNSGNNSMHGGQQSMSVGNLTTSASLDLGAYTPMLDYQLKQTITWNVALVPGQWANSANAEYNIGGGWVNVANLGAQMAFFTEGINIFLGAYGTTTEVRSVTLGAFEIIEGLATL